MSIANTKPAHRLIAFMGTASCSLLLRMVARFGALAFALILTTSAFAAAIGARDIQFDVFVGYNSDVREGGWYPVVIEIENEGPTFTGTVELSGGPFGGDQSRLTTLELPTETRKRFVVPMFCSTRYGTVINAQLRDQRGKVRSEMLNIQPTVVAADSVVLGALPLTFAGMPPLPTINKNKEAEAVTLRAARLETDLFPDNAITLESLDAVYMNSQKAVSLKPEQAAALVNWVRSGGRLILAVEQVNDINSTPWLQQFIPMQLTATEMARVDDAVNSWLRGPITSISRPIYSRSMAKTTAVNQMDHVYYRQPLDAAFVSKEMPVARGTVREGATILIEAGGTPLVVSAPRGRGDVTVLTFSPERDPFKSWKNLPYFWARMLETPSEWFDGVNMQYGGWSVDEVFGSLLDSRQVRKLPVGWLLLLLVVYLIVIGPLDQYWLKKINRQMLTWITFPAYVAFFSLLIYYIGYRLRAGETEWNEMHVVDVLPRGQKVDLRGRTFASVYSSENARYRLANDQATSVLRGEVSQMQGGRGGSGFKAVQSGAGYVAEIFVPVWTSLLYVGEWLQSDAPPFAASIDGKELVIENFMKRPLTELRVVVDGQVYEVGGLQAGEKRTIDVSKLPGVGLKDFLNMNGSAFSSAVEGRRSQFGDVSRGRLDNRPMTATVASFNGDLSTAYEHRGFYAPRGFDLTQQARRGDTIVFAFAAGHSFTKPFNQFQPVRLQRDTLLRMVIPAKKPL